LQPDHRKIVVIDGQTHERRYAFIDRSAATSQRAT
jgi:hypothetical protein